MTAIGLLFFTGALLLAAEVLLPGGVAGVVGGIALLAGTVMSFSEFGLLGGLVATMAALILLGVMLYLELVWLPRSRLGSAMVVGSTVEGQARSLPGEVDALVGRPALAATPLAPSGFVLVDGRRYEAFSRSGFVDRGTALVVVGVEPSRLLVSMPSLP